MSAPVNAFQQPPFSQDEAAATESKPVEPTDEELKSAEPTGVQQTSMTEKFPYLWLWVIIFVFVIIVGPILGVLSLLSRNDAMRSPSQAPSYTAACSNEQIELEMVNETETATSTYCATQAEYDALYAEAEVQYKEALTRGKPLYKTWLSKGKLTSAKTEKAQQMAAKTYICQVDFNDGSLYAATKAGLDESFIRMGVGRYLIEVDAYDPEDVYCVDGEPTKRPSNPQPSVQPKEPDRYPVPLPEGGAGSNNGPVDAP